MTIQVKLITSPNMELKVNESLFNLSKLPHFNLIDIKYQESTFTFDNLPESALSVLIIYSFSEVSK